MASLGPVRTMAPCPVPGMGGEAAVPVSATPAAVSRVAQPAVTAAGVAATAAPRVASMPLLTNERDIIQQLQDCQRAHNPKTLLYLVMYVERYHTLPLNSAKTLIEQWIRAGSFNDDQIRPLIGKGYLTQSEGEQWRKEGPVSVARTNQVASPDLTIYTSREQDVIAALHSGDRALFDRYKNTFVCYVKEKNEYMGLKDPLLGFFKVRPATAPFDAATTIGLCTQAAWDKITNQIWEQRRSFR